MVHELSCSLACMWDLPRPVTEPVSSAVAGGFFTTEPAGKPSSRGVMSAPNVLPKPGLEGQTGENRLQSRHFQHRPVEIVCHYPPPGGLVEPPGHSPSEAERGPILGANPRICIQMSKEDIPIAKI